MVLVAALGAGCAWAEDKEDRDVKYNDGLPRYCTDEMIDRLDKISDDKLTPRQKQMLTNCNLSTNYNACPAGKAQSEFQKAISDFGKACGGISKVSSPSSGWPGCSESMAKCIYCPGSGGSNVGNIDCSGMSTGDESTGADGLSQRGKNIMSYCPSQAGADQADLEKQLKESKEEVDRMKKDLEAAKKEYDAEITKQEEEVSEHEKAEVEAQKELDDKLDEAKSNQKTAMAEIQNEIVRLEGQIAGIDDSLRKLELSKIDALEARDKAMREIDLNCHASGTANAAKMQADAVAQRKDTRRGDFKAMLKQVGLTDRENYSRIAKKFKKWCMDSEATIASKVAVEKGYEAAVRHAADNIKTARASKEAMLRQVDTLKVKTGCGAGTTTQLGAMPAPNANKACDVLKQAVDDADKARRNYAVAAAQLKNKQQRAQQKAMQKMPQLAMKIGTLEQELAAEEKRMKDAKAALIDATAVSSGGGKDAAEKFVNARMAFGGLEASARTLTQCMGSPTRCSGSSQCKDASAFLKNIGLDPFENAVDPAYNGDTEFEQPAITGTGKPGEASGTNSGTGTPRPAAPTTTTPAGDSTSAQ